MKRLPGLDGHGALQVASRSRFQALLLARSQGHSEIWTFASSVVFRHRLTYQTPSSLSCKGAEAGGEAAAVAEPSLSESGAPRLGAKT